MTDLDHTKLDKELDKVKTKVFTTKNGGFLGPLMSSVSFMWTEDIKTAQTNGISLQWNPHWFLELPVETRMTVLLHELWHIALLHMLRRGLRDPKVWNWACDLYINNMLFYQGYTFDGTTPWLNDDINRWKHPSWIPIGVYDPQMAVEEIYDQLIQLLEQGQEPLTGWAQGDGSDILEPDEKVATSVEHSIVSRVVTAANAAALSGDPTGLPTDVETTLKKFLSPKVAWEILLMRFFTALFELDYSWRRPNRRYQTMYLPSLMEMGEGLDHLIYYLDISGSVSDAEVIRFNSEVKHIKDTYNPRLLTLVLFDTVIHRIFEFTEEDPFEEIVITGRGGTSLVCVRDHMIANMPTAAIIFSDLECRPMQPLPDGINIPTIFVGVNARPDSKVLFGQLIHIRE